MRKVNRVGERAIMNNGMECEIIRYNNKRDIDVKFKDGYISYNKEYGNFKKGNIKNPYVERVFGVGVYDKIYEDKKIYTRWIGILKRCYSEKELKNALPIKMYLFVKSGKFIATLKSGIMKIIMKSKEKRWS